MIVPFAVVLYFFPLAFSEMLQFVFPIIIGLRIYVMNDIA